MQDRRALIVDKDRRFADRLARLLRAVGVAADVIESRREALDRVAETAPSILFLAVEQPQRAGFALFSDVKRIARQTPVVLVTSTVSKAEMSLHQKLRIHADAYLDRREIDDAMILETASDLLTLRIDEDEARRITAQMPPEVLDRPSPSAGAAPTVAPRDIEPALASLLAELGVDASQIDTPPERPHPVDLDPDADDRIADLERRLEAARQAARSSPFASDYLALAERVAHAERSAASVGRELDLRTRTVERQRTSLVQLAARLLDAERGRREAVERIRTLDAECARFREEQRRSQDALVSLDRQMSAERRRGEDEARSRADAHARELAARDGRHAEALAHERSRWTGEIERLRGEHEAEIAHRVEEHRRELAELQASLQKTIERHEHQIAAEMLKADDVHQRAIERIVVEWQARLTRTEQALRNASREATASQELRHQEAVAELIARHRAECERLRQENAATAASLRSKLEREVGGALDAREAAWRAQLDAARAEHVRELEAERQRHAADSNRLAAAHERALVDQARRHEEALAQGLEEAHSQRIQDGTRRLDELEESERRHRAELAALEQRYREEIELLSKLHEVELERASVRHGAGRDPLLVELSRKLPSPSPSTSPGAPANDEIRRAIEALESEAHDRRGRR